MILRSDITELERLRDTESSVMVVKNEQRFEWPSLMYFNNEKCKELTPEYIDKENPFKLNWAENIGELPSEWNHLVLYDNPRDDAKLVHFTAGIPCFDETKDCEYANEWRNEFQIMNMTCGWEELMGQSRHVDKVKNIA